MSGMCFWARLSLWQWLPLAASIYAKSKKQHTLISDFKKWLDKHASLIQACHTACSRQAKLIEETVQHIEVKVTMQEGRAEATKAIEQEQSKAYAEAVKSPGKEDWGDMSVCMIHVCIQGGVGMYLTSYSHSSSYTEWVFGLETSDWGGSMSGKQNAFESYVYQHWWTSKEVGWAYVVGWKCAPDVIVLTECIPKAQTRPLSLACFCLSIG